MRNMRRSVPFRSSAAALLSLLTAVASLSASPQRTRGTAHPSIAAAIQLTSRNRRKRQAPLVDSDLLRFLSEQQRRNQRISVDEILATEGRACSDDPSGAALLPIEEPAFGFAPKFSLLDETAWLQQYRSPVVVKLLMEGAGAETAQKCAQVIETAAVTREARRRVRCFLKTRNEVWGTSRNNSTNNNDGTIITASTTTATAAEAKSSNTDNLEQVVDLLLSYGLTQKDVAEILIHSPGVAFMRPTTCGESNNTGSSLQETVERAFTGLLMGRTEPHHLGLRKYDARKVLRNTPGLLSLTGSKAATEMVVLLTRLGVSCTSLSRDKNALPVLLSRQPAAVFRLIAFLSSDAVRMPMDQIGPLLRRAECQDLLNAVAPCLKERQSVGVVAAQVRREVVHDTYRRMSATAWTLRHEIGTEDLGKVIAAYPSVLLLSAHRQILPVAAFLMDELGIWEDDLPRVLQLYPVLLRMDVEQMRNIVAYLASLEVAQDSLASIFRSFPVLLTLDVQHDMEPVVEFLQSVGVHNVGRFITRLPPVLGYSVEKELRPKFDFLATYVTDPRFEVSKFPAFFSYPLERVIKTRFEYLRQIKGFPTALLSLDQVLCNGDRDFATRIARDKDGGVAFAEFAADRKEMLAGLRNNKKQRRKRKQNAQIKSRRELPPPQQIPPVASPVAT